jgi:hypothetical protein
MITMLSELLVKGKAGKGSTISIHRESQHFYSKEEKEKGSP